VAVSLSCARQGPHASTASQVPPCTGCGTEFLKSPGLIPQVHAPLGVVAVCGRARQGKSYILNRCEPECMGSFFPLSAGMRAHGEHSSPLPPLSMRPRLLKQTGDGFVVGPTHRPCTKGLWMWSEPQLRNNADGTKQYMVLLDTEGIDAWDQVGGVACLPYA
jgi:hypothetical protein